MLLVLVTGVYEIEYQQTKLRLCDLSHLLLVLVTGVYKTKSQQNKLLHRDVGLLLLIVATGVYKTEYQQTKLLLRDKARIRSGWIAGSERNKLPSCWTFQNFLL